MHCHPEALFIHHSEDRRLFANILWDLATKQSDSREERNSQCSRHPSLAPIQNPIHPGAGLAKPLADLSENGAMEGLCLSSNPRLTVMQP